MNLYHENDWCKLYHGDSSEFVGDCDLILTNIYAPLPYWMRKKPMLICDFAHRYALAEKRTHTHLSLVSFWDNDINCVWGANFETYIPINLKDLETEPEGWFPDALPYRLLSAYAEKGMTILDGFMGRGTVGKACRELGLNFIGIDNDLERVKKAYDYTW